jgi:hypothetical protein
MDGKILVAETNAMMNRLKIKSDSGRSLRWGFFITKIGLSALCQKKTRVAGKFHQTRIDKTLLKIGGRGGI